MVTEKPFCVSQITGKFLIISYSCYKTKYVQKWVIKNNVIYEVERIIADS